MTSSRSGAVRSILPREGVGNAQVLLNQRAPRNRRRVRRQHELHAQRRGGRVQRVRADAAREQPREGFLARSALRRGRGIAQVRPSPAHAVVLLGDVGQRQEMGKGARDGDRRFDGQCPQKLRQRVQVAIAARPAALRQCAYALDDIEERRVLTQLERLSKKSAEQSHVVSKPFVGVSADDRHIVHYHRL